MEVKAKVERAMDEVVVELRIPFERAHLSTIMGELYVWLYLKPEEAEALLSRLLEDYACLPSPNRVCSGSVA